MKSNQTIPNGVINPFSEAFLPTWDLWKQFRKEEHSFTYKGVISEQMALKRLVEVSEGDEQKAIRIIEQSCSRGWMDFYKLKQPSNNGKSSQRTVKPEKPTNDNITTRVRSEFDKRYGEGSEPGGESYLKAV